MSVRRILCLTFAQAFAAVLLFAACSQDEQRPATVQLDDGVTVECVDVEHAFVDHPWTCERPDGSRVTFERYAVTSVEWR